MREQIDLSEIKRLMELRDRYIKADALSDKNFPYSEFKYLDNKYAQLNIVNYLLLKIEELQLKLSDRSEKYVIAMDKGVDVLKAREAKLVEAMRNSYQLGSANKYNTISNKDYNKILDYIYKVLSELGIEVEK